MQKSQRNLESLQDNPDNKFGRFSILQNDNSDQQQNDFLKEQNAKGNDQLATKDNIVAASQKDFFDNQTPPNFQLEDTNPFDLQQNKSSYVSQSSLKKNEQMESQAITQMRKSTGNILQENNDSASFTSPFAPHKMLTENNINNFKPPQKTRTSWAPVNTQTESKMQIPRLSGLVKIQQSTPSSLREFRSSAPAKLTPRSLFAFRSIGDSSALNEEEEEDSMFMDEKDTTLKEGDDVQIDESPKDLIQQEQLKGKNDEIFKAQKQEQQEESSFFYEDSDQNEQGSVNPNHHHHHNQQEIFNLFPQSKDTNQDDIFKDDQNQNDQKSQEQKLQPDKIISQDAEKSQATHKSQNSSQNQTIRSNRKASSSNQISDNNISSTSSRKSSLHNSKDQSSKLKCNLSQNIDQTRDNNDVQHKTESQSINQQPKQPQTVLQSSEEPEFLLSKPQQQELEDEDLISDVKLLQSIQTKPQNLQQHFTFKGETNPAENLQEIPMDKEMKKQILKMKIAQEKVQVMPLDDSFSLLSNQIYTTIEKKKRSLVSSQLNTKSSNFSPNKKSASAKKVIPNMKNNAIVGSPLATALSRTASTTPSQTNTLNNKVNPPPGFVQAQSPQLQDERKILENPGNIQVPSFEYNSPYSVGAKNNSAATNYQNLQNQQQYGYMYQQPFVNLNPPPHPFSTQHPQNFASPPLNYGYGYPNYNQDQGIYNQQQAYNSSPMFNQFYDQSTNTYFSDYNSPRSPQQSYSNTSSPIASNFNNFYQPQARGMIPNNNTIPPLIGRGSDLPSAQVLLETNAPVAYSDLLNNVLEIAVQQSGYKLIQRQLQRIDPHSENGKTLFKKLLDHFERISNDPLGNFLSQSLIEIYYQEYIRSFYNALRPNFLATCENIHGTRVMQKVISVAHSKQAFIKNNEGEEVLKLFKQDIAGLVKTISTSIHGNYVIQASLIQFKNDKSFTDPIYAQLCEACVFLCTHKNGCCVMQKALEQGGYQERKMLADEIFRNLNIILPDLFGNYVIQFMIKLKMTKINQRLCKVILENIVSLSNEKCSSNVVQKCLEHASRQDQDEVVDYITTRTDILRNLIFNQYGNYVVQKALEVLPKASKRYGLLMHQVKKMLPEMRDIATTNSQISQIYGRFLKKYPELQYQSNNQNLNSKQNGQQYVNNDGYNNYYHNNNNYRSMNNYHYHKNRGHSGKKQPVKRNYGPGAGGVAGYMVMNSPKGELPHYNYIANSPPPPLPQPTNFNPHPPPPPPAAAAFDAQYQTGSYANQGAGYQGPVYQQQAKYYNMYDVEKRY